MPLFAKNLIRQPVHIERADLRSMIRLVRDLYILSRLPAYREAIRTEIPDIARFDPGHDAVMMGYDFHLTADGPRLIEVNTNAGGGLIAYLSHLPEDSPEPVSLPDRLKNQILDSFTEEFFRFTRGVRQRPRNILILDEQPEDQFLYPEMQVFRQLFEQWGVPCAIADPKDVEERNSEVFYQGNKVEMIYNRHCDFYLETQPMAGIARAYLARNLCLTPNPFAYALLGDKRRMALWSDSQRLEFSGLARQRAEQIFRQTPYTRRLADLSPESLWKMRKQLVFKPATRFGSRGVYMGERISRSRFDTLPAEQTLVQALVAPSLTWLADREQPMKTDFRLFVYRDRPLGIAARLYRGQVTNLQSEGSGFAPVQIVKT